MFFLDTGKTRGQELVASIASRLTASDLFLFRDIKILIPHSLCVEGATVVEEQVSASSCQIYVLMTGRVMIKK